MERQALGDVARPDQRDQHLAEVRPVDTATFADHVVNGRSPQNEAVWAVQVT
jgi:hypothetical protein